MTPLKPFEGCPLDWPPLLPLKPAVPGAPEEKLGTLLKDCLKEGGGPTAGGGRGGREAWGCGVVVDDG